MKSQEPRPLDARTKAALAELEDILRRQYPDATFAVHRGVDDPETIQLWATVDVEDTDLVLDAVVDRVMQLQIDDALPIHVIPVRPTARVLAMRQSQARELSHHAHPAL